MSKQSKQEIIAVLEASDVWTRDRFGHFKISHNGHEYRLKIQPLAIRYEKKSGSDWFCKASDHYKNVTVPSEGYLRIENFRLPITSGTMPKPPVA